MIPCKECDGHGQVWCEPFNPSEQAGWGECRRCNGSGYEPVEENSDNEEENLCHAPHAAKPL